MTDAANTPRTANRYPRTPTGRALIRHDTCCLTSDEQMDAVLAIENEAATPTHAEPLTSGSHEPEGLDVERLRMFAQKVAEAEAESDGTRAAARYALTGSLEGVVDAMRARLVAARPDTPASAEQPRLRKALEHAADHVEFERRMEANGGHGPCDACFLLVELYDAALAASPSPEPEEK